MTLWSEVLSFFASAHAFTAACCDLSRMCTLDDNSDLVHRRGRQRMHTQEVSHSHPITLHI